MQPAFSALALCLGPWLAMLAEPPAPKELLRKASGTYQRGNGLSFNQTLVIADERYTLDTYDDSPLDNAPPQAGRTTVEAGAIVLSPALPGPSMSLLVISWGERLYLVEGSSLGEFCRTVKAGVEPRKDLWGAWFLRQGDWSTKVEPGSKPMPCRK